MKKNSTNSKKPKLSGADGFEQYYSELYGERWSVLKKAFEGEGSSVEYKVPGAEKSYFLDSASVLAALCLPLDGAEDILGHITILVGDASNHTDSVGFWSILGSVS